MTLHPDLDPPQNNTAKKEIEQSHKQPMANTKYFRCVLIVSIMADPYQKIKKSKKNTKQQSAMGKGILKNIYWLQYGYDHKKKIDDE